jgi:hypothetical protein
MITCNRCGKVVSNVEWDIHTCTPKLGLCDDCETVSHCLKHGCIPKHQALTKMAREAGFHVVGQRVFSPVIDGSDMAWLLERFATLVRADERSSWPAEMEAMERQVNILTDTLAQEREACANLVFHSPPSDEYQSPLVAVYNAIRARSNP